VPLVNGDAVFLSTASIYPSFHSAFIPLKVRTNCDYVLQIYDANGQRTHECVLKNKNLPEAIRLAVTEFGHAAGNAYELWAGSERVAYFPGERHTRSGLRMD
jgi:hypothetical protein